MSKLIKALIMPKDGMAGFIILIVVVVVIEVGIAYAKGRYTVRAANVVCTVKSIDPKGDGLIAALDCGGSNESVDDNKFIASYIKNPKPVSCTLYGAGDADCRVTKQ